MEQKTISRSKEDYLKTILILKMKYGACRCADISKQLGVSKSSSSVAIRKLEEEGLVIKDDWRILLTEKGQGRAEKLYEKSNFLAEWFKDIGVSASVADKDACMIEHVLSEETYHKIQLFLKDVQFAKV